MRKTFAIFAALLMLVSCEDGIIPGGEDGGLKNLEADLIIGNWSQVEYSDSVIIMTRVTKLPDDEYGISLKKDGSTIEWKNVGFCGTPPITYGEFEGTWELAADSVLTLETNYWGGKMLIEWKVIQIDDKLFKYSVLEYQEIPD